MVARPRLTESPKQSQSLLGGSAYGGPSASALENLALLQSLFGTSTSAGGVDGGTSGQATSTAGAATYNTSATTSTNTTSSVGGNTTANGVMLASAPAAAAPTTSGSSTGNTAVTQGV